MRINKYLATCGVASRRACDALIQAGRVKLNGRLAKLGTEVEPRDIVTLDGERATPIEEHVYLMMNKPKGYVCTVQDEKGRKTVLDLLHDESGRIFPVGRLDYDTEGLLLLTTDGDFANLLTHPSRGVPKTYVARIEGAIKESELAALRNGVMIEGEKTKPAKVKLLEYDEHESRVQVIISEGRNRQVRRMFETIGKNLVFLKRTQIGELRLGGLARGTYRALTVKEVGYFLTATPTDTKQKGSRRS